MNTQPTPSEDPLEVLLRKDYAPLADDGFSARVLAAIPLPEPKARRLPSRRFVLCSIGGLAGAACAYLQSGISTTAEIKTVGTALVDFSKKLEASTDDLRTLAIVATVVAVSFTIAYSREILAKVPKL